MNRATKYIGAALLALFSAAAYGDAFPPAGNSLVWIATLTANAAANLQFSGSNWSSAFNSVLLDCPNLVQNGAGPIIVVVGEGAGPTWETGAHYTKIGPWACVGSAGDNSSTTNLDLTGNTNTTPGWTTASRLYVPNVASSTLYKTVQFWSAPNPSAAGGCNEFSSNWWNNDTNPVTGLEVVVSSSTFSGTCSLYGLN